MVLRELPAYIVEWEVLIRLLAQVYSFGWSHVA